MKKIIMEMAGDWKNWVILLSGLAGFLISLLYDNDWTESLWIIGALALWFVGNIQQYAIKKAEEYIKAQDDLLSKADYIISTQTELIKELEDKLNGKN